LLQGTLSVRADGHGTVAVPAVDAGEGDMLPFERREVPQILLGASSPFTQIAATARSR
jgi:hypothetical protein